MRRQLIRPLKSVSVRRQCDLLSVNRSSVYYRPVSEKPENLAMMRLMDPHLLHHPTEGVLSMVDWLRDRGFPVGHKRVRRLFGLMGHRTMYRKKKLSRLGDAVFVKPYLLKGLVIDHPNQVWCTDITYVPMKKGFMYLTAILDVYSRKILSWGISNTLAAAWCKQVLEQAIDQYGSPEIINTDQGSQYTCPTWVRFVEDRGIGLSMDGKGRALDNVWIERFWRTIKEHHIYLNPADDGFELYEGVQSHIAYYNKKRHQTTGEKPNERHQQPVKTAA